MEAQSKNELSPDFSAREIQALWAEAKTEALKSLPADEDDDTDEPCGEELYGYEVEAEDEKDMPFTVYGATYADTVLNPGYVPGDARTNARRINRATVLGLAVEAYLSHKQNGGKQPTVLSCSENSNADYHDPLYRALYEYVSFSQTYVGEYDTISEVKAEADFWLHQVLAQVGAKLGYIELGPLPKSSPWVKSYCDDIDYRIL